MGLFPLDHIPRLWITVTLQKPGARPGDFRREEKSHAGLAYARARKC